MNKIESILLQLKELKDEIQSNIKYEEEKENIDMCKLLTSDLIKVVDAIHALED